MAAKQVMRSGLNSKGRHRYRKCTRTRYILYLLLRTISFTRAQGIPKFSLARPTQYALHLGTHCALVEK